MSMLRSALDELRSHDVSFASDEELTEDLVEIERASRVLEAERSRRLAEVDRRSSWRADGHLSPVSWLAAWLRIGFGRASEQVKLARALSDMPATSRALSEAEISGESARLLAAARAAAPDVFVESEEMLVDAARALPARELQSAIAYWRQNADGRAATEREQRLRERRRLHVSPLMDGMVRVDGDLDPESGQTVITALRAMEDAWARSDDETRTPAQRRADALTELCRSWLDRSDRPSVAGERPHLVVTVDLASLEGRAGRRCELDQAGVVTPEAARRLACDAGVSRVLLRGASEPLDVGRRTPVVPSGIRRALTIRDRGCRFPECGRPIAWCDAHHVRHWADGGETSLDNLMLLCRPHHRAVHREFRVAMLAGAPRFTRSEGSTLEGRAPP
jgi:hypothetical protein